MSKNYKQYDTRWAKLGYPKAPWYIKDCGCGEVAIANSIDKCFKYKDETPKTILPYCRQFAAPNGDGTYWSAPPTMMEHYGMTHVKEHSTMASLWKELEKGDRVAIYLMSNRLAGSGVKWTGSKHFICSVAYKRKDGKHMVYIKDSNSDSKEKNGWHSYEAVLKNAVFKVWSGKLPKTIQEKICEEAKEIADSGKYRYKKYTSAVKTHQCPICHKLTGRYKGWNCIGFAFACWHHAGIKCKCSCDVLTDQIYNELLRVSLKKAKRIVADRIGLDEDEFKIHRNGGKAIPFSKLKKGDIIVYYTSSGYKHTAIYIGDGKIADCTSGRNPQIKYGAKSYKGMTIKFAISYTGK